MYSEKEMLNIFTKKLEDKDIAYQREVFVNSFIADLVIDKKEIAIEAKLSDIKKAIIQLCAYKEKYKNSILLMPFKKKKLVQKYRKNLIDNNLKWVFVKKNGEISFGHSSWKKMLFS